MSKKTINNLKQGDTLFIIKPGFQGDAIQIDIINKQLYENTIPLGTLEVSYIGIFRILDLSGETIHNVLYKDNVLRVKEDCLYIEKEKAVEEAYAIMMRTHIYNNDRLNKLDNILSELIKKLKSV